jgi:hypothetical protein
MPSFTQIDIAAMKSALRERMGWRASPRSHGLPAGVLGIGFGWKRALGKRVTPNCLRVYVRRKLPKGRLPLHKCIPKHLHGIPIDVIPTSAIRAHAVTAIQPGTSIGDADGRSGTLGCIVTDGTAQYLLGSWHVMDYQNAGDGAPVYMPPPRSGAANVPVGSIVQSPNISLSPATPIPFDAAIATLAGGAPVDPTLPGLGSISATLADLSVPHDQLPTVTMAGCATQGQSGASEAIAEDVQIIYYNDSSATGYLVNQIGIVGNGGPFSDESDSGALVVTQNDWCPVGILVGGGASTAEIEAPHSFVSPISVILDHYQVTIVS